MPVPYWNSLGYRVDPSQWDAYFGPSQWSPQVAYAGINWFPEWFQNAPNQDTLMQERLNFRRNLGSDADQEFYEQAWNEYRQFLVNQFLDTMSPDDARRFAQALAVSGDPEFAAAYNPEAMAARNQSFGFNEVYGWNNAALGGRADRYLTDADRYREMMERLNYANYQLFGGLPDTSEFSDDAVTDPFERTQNWLQSVLQLGAEFGTNEERKRRSRWQEAELARRWNELARQMPDEEMLNFGYSLLFPTMYSSPSSQVAFSVGNYRYEPSTSSYGSPYAYRNPSYL